MNKANTKTYFSSQIICWSIFALIHVIISLSNMPASFATVFNGVFIGLTGFFSSHLLRLYFVKSKLDSRPYKSLILFALLAIAVATAIWEALIILVLHVGMFKFYTLSTMSKPAVLFWFYYYFVSLSVWSLIYFIVKIISQRRAEAIEKLELEIALRDAQLQNLKWQMNPHFLFNSLNSVKALISEDTDRAKDMITKMSSLLRHALYAPENKTIELVKEIECAHTYLELEKVRFEERLNFNFNIDPSCLTLPILPMCMQTLVENAVKHGIAHLPQGGHINVKANKITEGMRIEIENSGRLVTPVQYGTGLKNTEERIHMVFGADSSIQLLQKDAETVLTTLDIHHKS